MKNLKKSGFTLVELLVVITILTIISVVAYQNFGGATEKAINGRKINDVSAIETSLMQYKSDKNYYPAVGEYEANTNVWGYNSGSIATPSNQISYSLNGEEISKINTGSSIGGGEVHSSGTIGQIGAKGTIGQEQLSKQYLSKDLYDPSIGDKKVVDKKMIDYGIGRYVYGIYNKTNWTVGNRTGKAYNIAFTVKDTQNDTYVSKIVGDFDEESCRNDKLLCPKTLIGTASGLTNSTDYDGNPYLLNEDKYDNGTPKDQGIPYPVDIQ